MPKFRDLMAASAIVAIAFNSIEAGASTPTPNQKSLQSRPPQSDSWQTAPETAPETSLVSAPHQETFTQSPTTADTRKKRLISPVDTPEVVEKAEPTEDSALSSLKETTGQETPEKPIDPSNDPSNNPKILQTPPSIASVDE
ncbi:MAG: hypothetical protein WBG66_15875, partial [Geitlerinemataceae cyanobacterium]